MNQEAEDGAISGPFPKVAVALDIGGSKTRGIRIADGQVTDELVAGSANLQNVTREQAARHLEKLLLSLGADDAQTLVVGSGGVDTVEDKDQLQALLAPHARRANIVIVHDTRLILAADGASTGIAVIAGTGSAAWGTNETGAEARAGGWGFLLGDEGSGYWLGREAVRHCLALFDRSRPTDALAQGVLAVCGLTEPADLIALFHGQRERRFWADVSRVVFDLAGSGHPASMKLVEQAAEHLAAMTMTVADRLDIKGPVVLGGGLGMNQPLLRRSYVRHLLQRGTHDVRTLSVEPVHGALHLLRSWAASS